MVAAVRVAPNDVFDDGAMHMTFGVAPATLDRACRDGSLKFTRKGRRRFFTGRWVLDWLGDRTGEVEPAGELAGVEA
jgi:hypothetical protein